MMDGRTNVIGHRVGPLGHQATLAHGLGEGVGVGPPERVGPGRAGVDQFRTHPLLADLLGSGGDQVLAGPADFRAGRLGELGQLRRLAGRRLEVVPQAAGGVHLVVPIHLQGEAVLREQLLLRLPLVGAGHIGGRHGDQVRPRTRGGHGGTDPGRAEQVDLDRLGQGGVERDGGGGVDDHVAGGQGGPALVIEPQPVLPDVARDGPDPAGHLGGESVAQLGTAGGRSSRS